MNVSPGGDPNAYPTFALLRRLLVDEALVHWRRYLIAAIFMAIAAAGAALSAYLIGTMTNEAWVNKNFHGIVIIGLLVMVIFGARGLATYFSTVVLSRIGNRIVADNQRRMFDKLLHENMSFFADRHSSEFIARMTTGASAVSSVINLLITAIGRDLMSLIGLVIVMVTQDPIMSLGGLIVAPPAIFFLRKLVRRVRNIARLQFNSGTRIIETMQESLQGLRMVKAFSLEDEMQRRLGDSVAAVERDSNKMARVSNRSGPLMETLGGFAVALTMIYGGYRGIAAGATPGQFVSFLAAFLLAYEPAKRLARLNMDLNNGLVGVRVLYEIIDSPPGESEDSDRPPLRLADARLEFADVRFAYRANTPVLRGMSLRRPARKAHRVGRPFGRRQVDHPRSDPALLHGGQRPHPDRRAGHRRRVARLATRADRLCRAGRVALPRQHPRQYRARPPRRQRSRNRRRRRLRMRTISFRASRSATTRQSASTACNCRAASASASPSPAP